ncbi:uncharacterized protein LOC135378319 [Ornithodoros turicata]|uniref:uncharacterized protein LOC135378319 n=1 Tax=Ornithodoros turicata TaxID=34597 RepID=UPI00313A1214
MNRQFGVLKGNSVDAILPQLKVSHDGEPFLRFEERTEGRRMLIFFADKDLEGLQAAEYVLGDGNFKFNPPEFHNPGQFYTLHVVVKAHPFLYALMQRMDRAAYETLFTVLRDGLIRKFGHVHTLSTSVTWLFDFEMAAILAVKTVSSGTQGAPKVHGCAFHYAKALNTKRDELGLKKLCAEHSGVALWMTRVRHLPFVPDEFRLQFAEDLLAAHPDLPPLEAARLQRFSRYFARFWIQNAVIKDICGQFKNTGPRTTNMAEGWHNGLLSRIDRRHPSLAELLQWLQTSQHATQNRMLALRLDPLAVGRPQCPSVLRRNRLLLSEMDRFETYVAGHVPTFADVANYLDSIIETGVLLAS